MKVSFEDHDLSRRWSGVVIERLNDEFQFNENRLIPGNFPENYENVTGKNSWNEIAENYEDIK